MICRMRVTDERLSLALATAEHDIRTLFAQSLQIQSVSGQERLFTQMIADWAQRQGFSVDLWQADETQLQQYPAVKGKHIPLANRPTCVIKLPGSGSGQSLIFNGHSDVVPAPHAEKWTDGPWSGNERDGKFYGRGACDVKGAIASALWAMLAIKEAYPEGLNGDILLELVPGEEDCVTLGTITSIARGHSADGCIVLEPTEGLPRCASRGGCRYEIQCGGRAVHGTVKWLGEDAIELASEVLSALKVLEQKWNDPQADALFKTMPIARPTTTDLIHGGDWQGMICDHCMIAGYLELLPSDELGEWKQRLTRELPGQIAKQIRAKGQAGLNQGILDLEKRVKVSFPEEYQGHRMDVLSQICAVAEVAVAELQDLLKNNALQWQGWSGFNSGCEAGVGSGCSARRRWSGGQEVWLKRMRWMSL